MSFVPLAKRAVVDERERESERESGQPRRGAVPWSSRFSSVCASPAARLVGVDSSSRAIILRFVAANTRDCIAYDILGTVPRGENSPRAPRVRKTTLGVREPPLEFSFRPAVRGGGGGDGVRVLRRTAAEAASRSRRDKESERERECVSFSRACLAFLSRCYIDVSARRHTASTPEMTV